MESFDQLVKRHDEVLKLTTTGMKDMQDRHPRLMSIIEQQIQVEQPTDNTATDLNQSDDVSSIEGEDKPPEKEQDISDIDGVRIRKKAAEMLSYMATMPYRQKTGTWEDDTNSSEEETPQTQASQALPIKTNACEKCGKQSKSLIYCNKCPPNIMKLYRPECLLFLPDKTLRVCEQCASQPPDITIKAEPLVNPNASNMPTKDTFTTPKPSRISKSSDMEESDQSDSLPSSSSSDSFPPPVSFKRSTQTPNYLARTNIPGSSLQDSPIKTRAARKAASIFTQEDTTDTDDQTANSRE